MRKSTQEELKRLSIDEFKSSEKTPLVVILENIRSLNNIGSVFRTSDAFRLEKICLCGITACPPHRDIHKTALGSTESVDWEYYEDSSQAINILKNEGYYIISAEQCPESAMLHEFKLPNNKKTAVVFGNEVNGIEDKTLNLSDICVEIPQLGTKHSLNISVSAGIILWELTKKLKIH